MSGFLSEDETIDEKLFLMQTKLKTLEVLYRNMTAENEERRYRESVVSFSTAKTNSTPETNGDSFSDESGLSSPFPSPQRPSSLLNGSRSLRFRGQGRTRGFGFYPKSDRPDLYRKPSVVEGELSEEDDYKELSQDTFSLMILANPLSKQWWFGLIVFLLQGTLLIMIAVDQIAASKESTPFDVPYKGN